MERKNQMKHLEDVKYVGEEEIHVKFQRKVDIRVIDTTDNDWLLGALEGCESSRPTEADIGAIGTIRHKVPSGLDGIEAYFCIIQDSNSKSGFFQKSVILLGYEFEILN